MTTPAGRSVTATTILDFTLADAAQADFGAGPALVHGSDRALKTWCFVMTLCWSRHQYVELVFDQTVETWLAYLRRAFEWFGGCPGRIRPYPEDDFVFLPQRRPVIHDVKEIQPLSGAQDEDEVMLTGQIVEISTQQAQLGARLDLVRARRTVMLHR